MFRKRLKEWDCLCILKVSCKPDTVQLSSPLPTPLLLSVLHLWRPRQSILYAQAASLSSSAPPPACHALPLPCPLLNLVSIHACYMYVAFTRESFLDVWTSLPIYMFNYLSFVPLIFKAWSLDLSDLKATSRGSWIQTYFHDNTRMLFLLLWISFFHILHDKMESFNWALSLLKWMVRSVVIPKNTVSVWILSWTKDSFRGVSLLAEGIRGN